jgi:hypothetical protein
MATNHYEVGIATYGSADVLNAYGVIIAPSTSPAAATSTAVSAAMPVRHVDS